MSIAPATQNPQLLNFGVFVLDVIFERKSTWIIYSYVATKSEKDARYLVREQFRIRSESSAVQYKEEVAVPFAQTSIQYKHS